MALILVYQDRGRSIDFTINDAAGNPITPGGSDLVRCIIGREGETPLLTVTSGSPTDNGSSVTPGTTNRLRLDAADLLVIDPGTYTLFVDFFDSADANEWKNVERETLSLQTT